MTDAATPHPIRQDAGPPDDDTGNAILFRFSQQHAAIEGEFLALCRKTGIPRAVAARMLIIEALEARKEREG